MGKGSTGRRRCFIENQSLQIENKRLESDNVQLAAENQELKDDKNYLDIIMRSQDDDRIADCAGLRHEWKGMNHAVVGYGHPV